MLCSLEDYCSANLIPNHISEVKLKLDSALLFLWADLPAHAHLAVRAVPAAVPCPGSVQFLLKAHLLHGTQIPTPSLVPGRDGKLPQTCVWTKTCWGDQGAWTPVLSSANHGDCCCPLVPQHCCPLGQSHLSPSVLPLIRGPKETGREPWIFPLLAVIRMLDAVKGSRGQWEGNALPCIYSSLMECLGLLVGAGFAPAASPAPVTVDRSILFWPLKEVQSAALSHTHGCVHHVGYLRVWVQLLV